MIHRRDIVYPFGEEDGIQVEAVFKAVDQG